MFGLQLGFPDAEEHYLKAELVLRLDKAIKILRLTQRAAARRIETTQPEVFEYSSGKISLYRGMRGTYIHCKPQHLRRYLNERPFRYNHHSGLGFSDGERTALCLRALKA